MLLFALTTVAQPVYYTLFVSSCLRVPFSPTSLSEVPPPTSTPLKHWNLFVCCLWVCFVLFLTLGGVKWVVHRRLEAREAYGTGDIGAVIR